MARTQREPRAAINTDWGKRRRPITYKAPLQDAYRKVHDQNNKIIFILSNTGKLIPATFWMTRPEII